MLFYWITYPIYIIPLLPIREGEIPLQNPAIHALRLSPPTDPFYRQPSRLALTSGPCRVKSIGVARRPPSEADLERDTLWLDLVEDGWTLSQVAELTGYTKQRVHQRVQRARDNRAANSDPQPMVGDDDAIWLELTDSVPPEPSRAYYDLTTDSTSHDGSGTFVLVGTGRGRGLRRNRLGTGRHVDSGQRYQDRDDGLKGGKG